MKESNTRKTNDAPDALNVKFVQAVKQPGVYRDKGNRGLFLRVKKTEAGRISKQYVLRITVQGQRTDIGLGSAAEVELAEVRDIATDMRKETRAGRDPRAAWEGGRRRGSAGGPEVWTFERAAEAVYAERCKGWRNGKHREQWIRTLRTFAYPTIGAMPVGDVRAADLLRVLQTIWHEKPETARRVRQRIGTVLDWATTSGHRSDTLVNAAHAARAGLGRQSDKVKHHAAVPWADVPQFLAQVRASPSDESVRWALEFLLLTAARTGEVIGAKWSEIDLQGAVWTVPAERMKRGVEHRVPLSEPALQLLHEARTRWPGSRWLFPGQARREPLSNMALLMLMRRLGREGVPHGLRSSFRDWCADHGHDRDLAEAALAHKLGNNKTETSYLRTDLFEQRRQLMEDWAAFATSVTATSAREWPAPEAEQPVAATSKPVTRSEGEPSWLALVGDSVTVMPASSHARISSPLK